MSFYSNQLIAAADEVMQYLASHENDILERKHVWHRLVDEMRIAAEIFDTTDAENAIHAIARMIVDEFPLDVNFAPSFSIALSAMQDTERKRRLEIET